MEPSDDFEADPLRIWIGWDPRDEAAVRACEWSLLKHHRSGHEIELRRLIQADLRERGLYWRPYDATHSTQFSLTRFLVPHLCGYRGWALFCDGDFIFTRDVAELFRLRDDRYAVMCVKHDFGQTEAALRERVKADGKAQLWYPRKWWSALVLWNCGHPANRAVDPRTVNEQGGAWLHRFAWLSDDLIGELPKEWHWLEGYSELPAALHYTRGGPWLAGWQHVRFADVWHEAAAGALSGKTDAQP